ncbi:hypothetical protein OG422_01645 [Streptomyces sp. NBC_01525]|uniref:hypothetical protein n=1 Tax=Streptomyces sp. NBC_01525 TaxID=2903893 RepID=UPI00386FEE93
MQDVAAGGGLGEQVRGDQAVEGAGRIRRGRAGERGGAEPVDVRARVMAERGEQLRGVGGQLGARTDAELVGEDPAGRRPTAPR